MAEKLERVSQLASVAVVSFPAQFPTATFPMQMSNDTVNPGSVSPDSAVMSGAVIIPNTDSAFVLVPNKTKHDIAAIKTNLLFDAATMLNVEVEIPLGRRMSIMWEDNFPWWEYGFKYCLEYWAMGPEARFYFRKWDSDTKFRGLYTGIYGLSGKYDFQYDKMLCYQGEFWSAGLSFGYAKAIGKKQRVIMDLSFSAGYVQSDYRHYKPADDYSELIKDNYNTGKVNYMGPTKVKITLSVPVRISHKAKEVSHE